MIKDRENIGKNPKFMILLCTIQKLWLFVLYPNMGKTREKTLMFAIRPRRANYPSNIVFLVLIVFVDCEDIGKHSKSKILLCSVQTLYLFVLCPNYVQLTIFGYITDIHNFRTIHSTTIMFGFLF